MKFSCLLVLGLLSVAVVAMFEVLALGGGVGAAV